MNVLIVAGGTPPTKKLLEQEIEAADLVIGADSGGHALLGYGFTPDIVIGDMDSFKYTNDEGINILEDPDQETNDLEKALNYVLKKGAKQAVVLGALGKRIDHVMKNMSVLQQFWPRFGKIIYRDDYGDTFLVRSPFRPELPVGTIISFFPVRNPVEEFTSTGVLYPLTNSTLEMGGQDGSSNKITGKNPTITFKEGFLGVFVGNGDKMKRR
ncbi:MAG: thiamine diphosphokinase [Balneola sp.]